MRIKIRITGNEKSRGEKFKSLMERGATSDSVPYGWQEPRLVSQPLVELLWDRKLVTDKDRKGEKMAEYDGNFKGGGGAG